MDIDTPAPTLQMAPEGRRVFGLCLARIGDPTFWFTSGLHPHHNPRFYKYFWVINYAGDPMPGWAPQGPVHADGLCTYDAMSLFQMLSGAERGCCYTNRPQKRLGPGSPFVRQPHKPYDFAPAFEDDSDPIWTGNYGLTGHR